MGMISGFKCEICETEFTVDEYDDTGANRCPNCDQLYNYDEGQSIVLTDDQVQRLRELKGV